ncbi:unnamed protein product [Prorocentrum cordatum]|uniref:Uncharacterized protein n=1 Tax=Prorocentrum cordatum TaxID=2364126 RepID=A0ABN9TIR1_9DINO|nr:unnamed protein product [Polarella glacialis]
MAASCRVCEKKCEQWWELFQSPVHQEVPCEAGRYGCSPWELRMGGSRKSCSHTQLHRRL